MAKIRESNVVRTGRRKESRTSQHRRRPVLEVPTMELTRVPSGSRPTQDSLGRSSLDARGNEHDQAYAYPHGLPGASHEAERQSSARAQSHGGEEARVCTFEYP